MTVESGPRPTRGASIPTIRKWASRWSRFRAWTTLSLKYWRIAHFARPARAVPSRWLRTATVQKGDRVCLFVTYAPKGRIGAHALFHARAWARAGFKVILTVVLDDLDRFAVGAELDFASGVFSRLNLGYDFGAWAATIAALPGVAGAALIATANDSVFGPFDSFQAVLDRVEKADADVVGLTDSHEIVHHFQSYILFFRGGALRHRAFHRFWGGVRTGDRAFVVQAYELSLLRRMQKAGLRTATLFPAKPLGQAAAKPWEANPTLTGWRELVEAGFPFVKVQLMRENPRDADLADWESFVAARGYDPALIRDYLAARTPGLG